MKIIFNGKDELGKENSFKVLDCLSTIQFWINDYLIKTEDTEIVLNDLKQYRENYGKGLPFQERNYFKYFTSQHINITHENMIRAFGVTSLFTGIGTPYIPSEKDLKKYFFNSLSLDWTGKMDVQPHMYFLSEKLLKDNQKEISTLYSEQILQKMEIHVDENTFYTFYYLPFKFHQFQYGNDFNLNLFWNKIVKEINDSIRKFTRGN